MSIRFVVFDAVGTVMYPQPGVAEVYRDALIRHCELHLPEDRIRDAVQSALRQRSQEDSLRTDESIEYRFWSDLIAGLCKGHPAQQDCFDDLYAQFGDPLGWCCFDDVSACLDELRGADIGIAIASNFDRRLHPVLDGLAPLSAISQRFVSSEIGWRKPARPFFDHVCQQLDVRPDEVLFVGDDLRNDVGGALAAGCSSAWIHRSTDRPEPAPVETAVLRSLTEIPQLLLNPTLS